jgi:hypothetical protein
MINKSVDVSHETAIINMTFENRYSIQKEMKEIVQALSNLDTGALRVCPERSYRIA